jgi:type VI protein secretion system component Hcp
MTNRNNQRSEELALITPAEMEHVHGGESMSLNFEKYKTTSMESYLEVKLKNTLVSNWSTGGGY